ncbi:MAG: chemotaxis protein CheB [bacterium]|nr:chemotaxis protein CheB [bacterium]
MIKIVIVDDSPTARTALRHALESDAELYVVGEAETGDQALQLVRRHQPDLITMDVYLRRENGIDVTASIMGSTPRPILIITGISPSDPRLVYRAMEAGALEVIPKLPAAGSSSYERRRQRLVRLIKTLSRVPVVHRFRPSERFARDESKGGARRSGRGTDGDIVLIGASTGGPSIIRSLLAALPAPYPLPIAIVQHISTGFGEGFASWLAQTTRHLTVLVDRPLPIESGRVYIAADDRHLRFSSRQLVAPSGESPDGHQRPSVNVLFESAAKHWGPSAVAIVMTGMGSDGKRGLAALHGAGALTIAQHPESCTVPSMPQAAIESQVVDRVLRPEEISSLLKSLASQRQPPAR